MAGTYVAMRADLLDADDGDTATSFSLPILMLNDATESIKKVLEIGKEHKEAHTRDLVLMIVNIVFAIAAIVSELGTGAAGIAEIVDDPNSAPLVILGMITGAVGLKGGKPPRKVFKDAADVRRALSDALPDAFSAEVRRRDAIVQRAIKACPVP
ncbi:hypothetical protein PG990_013991 [Apiospora arundinis]|uniref:Killer toxin subunits alpha/beta n=1 Tax=Apiospora arundinis TaxID=335852 RepID=A0ABR2IAE0_9PEZI